MGGREETKFLKIAVKSVHNLVERLADQAQLMILSAKAQRRGLAMK
jgi:hypothetical protein